MPKALIFLLAFGAFAGFFSAARGCHQRHAFAHGCPCDESFERSK